MTTLQPDIPTPRKRKKHVSFAENTPTSPLTRKMSNMARFTIVTEARTNLSICTALVILERNSSQDFVHTDLVRILEERLVRKHYRFRCRVSSDYSVFEQVQDMDIEQHIQYVKMREVVFKQINDDDDQEDATHDPLTSDTSLLPKPTNANHHTEQDEDVLLRQCISELTNIPLDMSRPLWECIIIEDYTKGHALFLRVHHCIGDGTSLGIVLADLTDPEPSSSLSSTDSDSTKKKQHSSQGLCSAMFKLVVSFFKTILFILWFMIGAIRVTHKWLWVEYRKGPDPKTPFSGSVTMFKRVAWTCNDLTIQACTELGKKYQATINDVIMNVAAGAMDRYMKRKETPLKEPCTIRIAIPVNVRNANQMKKLGNVFGFVLAHLPLGNHDPVKRLQWIKKDMDYNKKLPEAYVGYKATALFRFLPSSLVAGAFSHFSSYVTAVMTNVRSFTKQTTIGNHAILDMIGFVPPPTNVAFGMMIASYNGKISFSVVADEHVVPDADVFMEEFVAEFKHQQATC